MNDTATDDRVLLARFVSDKSQDAFATIVHRYVNLVYGVALRRVRDPHLADDVTQAVFLLLSQRAGSLAKSSAVLPGWLHRAATYCASNAIKMNTRRQHHERLAATGSRFAEDARAAQLDDTSELSVDLDRAMSKLNDIDRSALLLRYGSDQSVEQVAGALNLSLDATKKRLQRALQKLRTVLGRHGGTLTSIASIESAVRSQRAAPSHVADAILSTAPSRAAVLISQGANTMFVIQQIKQVTMIVVLFLGCTVGAGMLLARLGRNAPAAPTVASAFHAATFGAITQRTVNDDGLRKDDWIDFDTGKLSDPGRVFPDRSKGASWARATGADAHCETAPGESGFYGLEMVIAPIDDKQFDTIDAEHLREEMKDAMVNSNSHMSADGDLPHSYQFKTREGGIGVAQITAIKRDAEQHGTITIRYKLVR